jgi:crotonobetainyl-CoA:carnitine CoA-transferase CaiB-like acyl-CoA transferase
MPGPLAGIKILDFTTLLPGPYATLFLADLGAEVLKITSRTRPDLVNFMPPFIPGSSLSAAQAYLGRSKRSLTLNLKDPRAREIIDRLIPTYDILIEQFRPGVMEGLGLGFPTLKTAHPRLIYCSLTGYGQDSPYAGKAGHDINYLARSGLMSYSGTRDLGPVLSGMQIADIAAGSLNAVIGILAAVIARKTTGQGQWIDVAMTDGAYAFNALTGARFLVDGEEPGLEGTFLNGGSLYDFYQTADGQYISFGGLEPKFFHSFCRTIGREDLIPGGVTPPNLDQVKKEVREIIKSKTRREWEVLFQEADACLEPVLSLKEAFEDDHARTRNLVVELPLPDGGTVRQMAAPIKFSQTQPSYSHPGVPLGTHNSEVLLEAGYLTEEIEEFEKTGLLD